jgi:hypothetical protein
MLFWLSERNYPHLLASYDKGYPVAKNLRAKNLVYIRHGIRERGESVDSDYLCITSKIGQEFVSAYLEKVKVQELETRLLPEPQLAMSDPSDIKLIPHKCDNCSRILSSEQLKHLWPNIPDLTLRIEPGNIVPSGECPHCGCLTYIVKNK